MGTSVIVIRTVGNHGCQRDIKSGGVTQPTCGKPDCEKGCIDAIAREAVERLRASGASIEHASIHHWPGQDGQVLDNLVTGKRLGSF